MVVPLFGGVIVELVGGWVELVGGCMVVPLFGGGIVELVGGEVIVPLTVAD